MKQAPREPTFIRNACRNVHSGAGVNGFSCIPALAKADAGIVAVARTDFAAGATKMMLFSGEVESLANKVFFARATNRTTNQQIT